MTTLNFGSLGIASIHAYGFTPIIKNVDGLTFYAVASRNGQKARAYAEQHKIPKAYEGYEALLADPDVHCVYIPLPNSLHAEWCLKALDAGKHVLCEKPVTANAAQAERVAAKVAETGLTFAEGFHYRYHPLIKKLEELVRGGAIGNLRYVSARFCEAMSDSGKAQYDPAMAGGALMDVGCYPVSFARWMAGCDDAEIMNANCELTPSGVDGYTRATIRFANGVSARISCSITRNKPMYAYVRGDAGAIFIHAPFSPTMDMRGIWYSQYVFLLRQGAAVQSLRFPKIRTYTCQLQAFRDAVLSGTQPETDIREGVANMRIIDAIFKKAGVTRPEFDDTVDSISG